MDHSYQFIHFPRFIQNLPTENYRVSQVSVETSSEPSFWEALDDIEVEYETVIRGMRTRGGDTTGDEPKVQKNDKKGVEGTDLELRERMCFQNRQGPKVKLVPRVIPLGVSLTPKIRLKKQGALWGL